MEIDERKRKEIYRKQLRRESFKRNWKLFSQSKLGMIGLGIVSLFLILSFTYSLSFFLQAYGVKAFTTLLLVTIK